MREVIFYKTVKGICPVEEFLDSLTGKQAQKVTWVLQLVETLPLIPKQYFKKLDGTDDIWRPGSIREAIHFVCSASFIRAT